MTDAEIEIYASFGHIANLLLGLFGTALGFFLGCVTALADPTLTVPQSARLKMLLYASLIGSVLFLIIWLLMLRSQKRQKQEWRAKADDAT